jgi:hypothetical protein
VLCLLAANQLAVRDPRIEARSFVFRRHDITVLDFRPLGFHGEENDTGWVMGHGLDRQIDVIDEARLFENKMVRRKHRHDRFRCALVDVHQGQKDARPGFFVRRLDDDILVRPVGGAPRRSANDLC